MRRKLKISNASEARFRAKFRVAAKGVCWEWKAACFSRTGYGAFNDERIGNHVGAHRFSYELANGPIPRGQLILHSCDNRKCVNPSHLFVGTQRTNMADKVSKGRQANGARHGMARLSETDAIEILSTIERHGRAGYSGIAKQYGVATSTISMLVNRKTWKHLGRTTA